MHARLSFYLRTSVEGGFQYDPIITRTAESAGTIPAFVVPGVGDVIFLYGHIDEHKGIFSIVARQFTYPSYGSMVWKETLPEWGPHIDLVVEPADGVFTDEVYDPEA